MTDPMVMRSVRVPVDLWDRAKAQATAEGRDLSTVVRELLETYLVPPEPDPEGDGRYADGVRDGRLAAAAEVEALADSLKVDPTAE